jgi:hypothetical protein
MYQYSSSINTVNESSMESDHNEPALDIQRREKNVGRHADKANPVFETEHNVRPLKMNGNESGSHHDTSSTNARDRMMQIDQSSHSLLGSTSSNDELTILRELGLLASDETSQESDRKTKSPNALML